MSIDPILEKALNEYRIPYPQNRVSSNGFIRWGKNQRYWAVSVDKGYFFGDFVTDLSTAVFPKTDVNEADRGFCRRKVEEQMASLEAERAFFYKSTQQRAQRIWENASPLTFSHEYLNRKKAINCGLKMAGEGFLIIPLSDINGTLWTLQFIAGNGKKRFLKNGKKAGNFFMFGMPKRRLFLCEGYATASSVYLATKECTVACFDAGNISKVALNLIQKYPCAELVLCADNDRFNQVNTGIEKAIKIAKLLKTKVIYPVFDEKDTQSTDFNDLHCWYGFAVVSQQIKVALGE